jgi:exo-1,4-beta-D-glucosaminidase
MFEAFKVNRPNTTGVIQWMLNSAWPGMLWQLYDWYLMPNGAFYGARNACRPLNIIYNYKDGDIYLSNEYLKPFDGLSAEIRVFNTSGNEVFSQIQEISIGENESLKVFDMPEIEGLTNTYFLDLRLKENNGNLVGTNFYWLSTDKDVLDFENSQWFITPNKSFADLTGINDLEKVDLQVEHKFQTEGDTVAVTAILENTSEQIAFFIELKIAGKESAMPVLPVFWDDNYISLLPGEKREVTGIVFTKDLGEDEAVFSYKGWNVK